jgi:hypothetical protein
MEPQLAHHHCPAALAGWSDGLRTPRNKRSEVISRQPSSMVTVHQSGKQGAQRPTPNTRCAVSVEGNRCA